MRSAPRPMICPSDAGAVSTGPTCPGCDPHVYHFCPVCEPQVDLPDTRHDTRKGAIPADQAAADGNRLKAHQPDGTEAGS